MANTENIEAKLCAYVEGDLDETDRAEIEKHLAANPQHRRMLSDLMRTRDLLRELPREKAPAEVAETLQSQLERSVLLANLEEDAASATMRIHRWPQLAAIAAVLALAIGLGLILYQMLPTPNRGNQFTILQDRAAGTTEDSAVAERDEVETADGPAAFPRAETATAPQADTAPSRREIADATAPSTTIEHPDARDTGPMEAPLAKGGHDFAAGEAGDELALSPTTPAETAAPPAAEATPPSPLAYGKAGRGLVDPFDELLPQPIPDRRLRQFAEQQLSVEPLVLLVETGDIDAAHNEVTRFLLDNSIAWHETPPREFPPLHQSQVAVSMASRMSQPRVQAKDGQSLVEPVTDAQGEETAAREEPIVRAPAAQAPAVAQQQQQREITVQQELEQARESRARRPGTPVEQPQQPERQIVARNVSQQQLAELSRRLIEDQSHLRNNVSLLDEPGQPHAVLYRADTVEREGTPVIAQGDPLAITVEEFANQPGLEPVTRVQVADDGTIELDVLGRVQAAGLTEQQLAERLVEQFNAADLIAEAKVKVERVAAAEDAVAAAPADRTQGGFQRQRIEQRGGAEQLVDLMIVLYQEEGDESGVRAAEPAP